jgi:type IV fimbrial biogenesis protein FimT
MKASHGSHNKGFTLVELLIVMAVAAISVSIAVPSFRTLYQNNRAASQANKFLSAVYMARSESVKRGVRVTLCPRSLPRTNPESCTGTVDWKTGWLLFTDEAGVVGAFDGADTLLQIWDEVRGNPSFNATASNLQFQSSGYTASAVSYTLTMPDCVGDQIRIIDVSMTGRAAVSTSTC